MNNQDYIDKTYYERAAIYLIWIGAILTCLITTTYIIEITFNFALIRFGQYGELIGGTVGSVWALAGVILFYDSLNYQRNEMKIQRMELGFQRQVMIEQTEQIKKQNITLEKQSVESTFFQLLNLQGQILSGIDIDISEVNPISGESEIKKVYGRDCFMELYQIYKRTFHVAMDRIWFDDLANDSMKQLIEYSFRQFYEEYQSALGHYFSNLYMILLFVEEKAILRNSFYVSLVKAQLSNYELNLLYFYCLSDRNPDFKKIAEKYGLLDRLVSDELIEITRDQYDPNAFEKFIKII